MFRKDKDYRLHTFLQICRATTFWNNFIWLLLYASLTYLHDRKIAALQIVASSRSTIQKLDRLRNVYKVYYKDNGVRLIDVVLVS